MHVCDDYRSFFSLITDVCRRRKIRKIRLNILNKIKCRIKWRHLCPRSLLEEQTRLPDAFSHSFAFNAINFETRRSRISLLAI